MKTMRPFWLSVVAVLLQGPPLRAGEPTSPDPYALESPEQRDARMAWWREARFGLFIHWGVYAVPAGRYEGLPVQGYGEWIMSEAKIPRAEYRTFANQFNPQKYDPDAWVRLAKAAGMKYIIITAKHHDGFALFDAAATDWDVAGATPGKKDLLAPLAEACRTHGIRLGFYYSQAQDWFHAGGAGNAWDTPPDGNMDEYIDRIAVPQVKQLLHTYGEGIPAVLWWDTAHNMNTDRAGKLIGLLKETPGIIHNNRLGGGYRGDTETPEQSIPATGFKDRDWETCMTMNGTWGYKSDDHTWKSSTALLRNLCDTASKGGNYLLNVGPTAGGEIPAESITRLEEIGKWMSVNGEAIYGTTASPLGQVPYGRVTHKGHRDGGTVYLHVFDWPADGKLSLFGLRNAVTSARLLDGNDRVTFSVEDGEMMLSLPDTAPDSRVSVIAVEYDGPLDITKPLPKADARGVVRLRARDVNIRHVPASNTQVEADNIGYWTNANVTVDWEFESPKDGDFDVSLEYACPKPQAISVIVGDHTFLTRLPATGDYTTYKTLSVGRARLAGGKQNLRIVPVPEGWQALNVRAVLLEPR